MRRPVGFRSRLAKFRRARIDPAEIDRAAGSSQIGIWWKSAGKMRGLFRRVLCPRICRRIFRLAARAIFDLRPQEPYPIAANPKPLHMAGGELVGVPRGHWQDIPADIGPQKPHSVARSCARSSPRRTSRIPAARMIAESKVKGRICIPKICPRIRGRASPSGCHSQTDPLPDALGLFRLSSIPDLYYASPA